MESYRFRSDAVTGEWKSTEVEAIDDAIESGQAIRKEGRLIWLSAGVIERRNAYEAKG